MESLLLRGPDGSCLGGDKRALPQVQRVGLVRDGLKLLLLLQLVDQVELLADTFPVVFVDVVDVAVRAIARSRLRVLRVARVREAPLGLWVLRTDALVALKLRRRVLRICHFLCGTWSGFWLRLGTHGHGEGQASIFQELGLLVVAGVLRLVLLRSETWHALRVQVRALRVARRNDFVAHAVRLLHRSQVLLKLLLSGRRS